jgi:hypothetical protein
LEFRKHYTDFTKAEYKLLNERVKQNNYKLTSHTIIRQKQKKITEDEIYRAITNGKIIEFHYKDSNRLLLRGKTDEKGSHICVVLDIDTGNIITAYDNLKSDNHYTLDTSKYISYIDISGLLKNTYKS